MPDLELEICYWIFECSLYSRPGDTIHTGMWNDNKGLNFLDVKIRNYKNYFHDFTVHHIPPVTNVQIKSYSNISPHIIVWVLKGFLSRTLNICSGNYLDKEIVFK